MSFMSSPNISVSAFLTTGESLRVVTDPASHLCYRTEQSSSSSEHPLETEDRVGQIVGAKLGVRGRQSIYKPGMGEGDMCRRTGAGCVNI